MRLRNRGSDAWDYEWGRSGERGGMCIEDDDWGIPLAFQGSTSMEYIGLFAKNRAEKHDPLLCKIVYLFSSIRILIN